MRRRVFIWKEIGETPLQALDRFRRTHTAYRDVPLTYAGRLDPMAEGVLLVLIGDACKEAHRYRALDKVYDVDVLLGVGSDTGDVLGIPHLGPVVQTYSGEVVRHALRAERGARVLPYPLFSSKTVSGKPLFLYALEGTAHTITIPTHKEERYRITLRAQSILSLSDLALRSSELLNRVPKTRDPRKAAGADFRIDAITKAWKELFTTCPSQRTFPLLRIRVVASSGTYMRSLAEQIGTNLSTRGLALSITRRALGREIKGLFLPLMPWE